MRSHLDLGRTGEDLACRFLRREGWDILDRNFRHHRKEIDIVARSGRTVAFVEVKTRAGSAFGHPLEAITHRKRREIEQVAHAWIHRHGSPADLYRFDAVAVLFEAGDTPRLEHVPSAWRAGE